MAATATAWRRKPACCSIPNDLRFNKRGWEGGGAADGISMSVRSRARGRGTVRGRFLFLRLRFFFRFIHWRLFCAAHSSSWRVCWLQTEGVRITNTHLTPAEKLTTGKKSPSVLKFSNMPWTGWPLILNEMLGAPRSRQQLTTSSEVKMCWFREATARGTRPGRGTRPDQLSVPTELSIVVFYHNRLHSPDQR